MIRVPLEEHADKSFKRLDKGIHAFTGLTMCAISFGIVYVSIWVIGKVVMLFK